MKTQRIKISKSKLVALPLLALLLLLSPCSVKGALQNALEVDVSKSLHKSKSAAPQLNICNIWEHQAQTETKQATKKDIKKTLSTSFSHRLFNTNTKRKASFWVEHSVGLNLEPPLYILYKRLKIYDLDAFTFV
ncbi:hypothetical protein ES676_05795 [Bizionia saleffrena]|uniref:Uncharacterized protein n=1 Tax=Bizionia saleffrena TaxID=291189 RepID=A0A8H2LHF6_9FLAO|nr:hypothetical protein [Bizionia saleffrena]TYB75961.1 hypothetical protein ES676_05795 [Bizionia saleffrena]